MSDPIPSPPVFPSLPPDASARDILQAMLPLVVQSACTSAASAARAATTMESLEGSVQRFQDDMKGRMDRLEEAVQDLSDERTSKIEEKKERTREVYQTLRSVFRPDVVIQTLVIVGTLVAFWFNMPQPQIVQVDSSSLTSPLELPEGDP